MADMSDVGSWMSEVHVRDHALEKAMMMVQQRFIPLEDHMMWAQRYWEFLRNGSIPLNLNEPIPDDLSSMGDWDLVKPPEDDVPWPTQPPEPDGL